MKISRIQKTILSSYTVIWLIAVALLLGTSRQMLQKRLYERQTERAHVVAENVALAVSDPLLIGELDRLAKLITELKKSDHDVAQAWLLDKSGKCVAATDETKLNQVLGEPRKQAEQLILQRTSNWQLEVAALVTQGKDTIGSFHMVYSPSSVQAMISSMMLIILAVSAGCMIGGLVLYSFIINRTIVRRIEAVTHQLDANSQATASVGVRVAASAGDISNGTQQQSAALEETCAALEQMTGMIKRNTASAQGARELGNQTRTAAEGGFADVQTMNHAMADIKSASDSIAKIIKTIDEISFQTNLLALNAAVEAARAGEAGAGFAVVADEVRSLAQRCAQSAHETATQIEDSIQKSERGVAISGKVAQSLQDILGKARQMDTLIGEIAQATTDQNSAITGINSSVSAIEQVMQAAATSTAGFVSLSKELSHQAEGFQAGMGQLKGIIGATSSDRLADVPALPMHNVDRVESSFNVVAPQMSARAPKSKSPARIFSKTLNH